MGMKMSKISGKLQRPAKSLERLINSQVIVLLISEGCVGKIKEQ
jgi:hypothetical protein